MKFLRDRFFVACASLVCSHALLTGHAQSAETVFPITPALRDQHQLPEFYAQAVDADGILILGSDQASAEGLMEAKYLVSSMLAAAPKLCKALAEAGVRVTVMAPSELTTDVPEHSKLTPKNFWNRRARGLGGTIEIPVTSCGEENLLEYIGDPYKGENILIHEFSHAVHLVGMAKLDATFDERLRSTYEIAKQRKLWDGTYAATNHEEYFAEGSQSWFSCNAPPGKVHGEIRTREALRSYDPGLAALLKEVYGDNPWQYSLPSERANRTKLAYNPGDRGRRFAWPKSIERLEDIPASD